MGIRTHIPPGATPLAAIDAIMAMYGRQNIEIAIETLIASLDQLDGDPDVELDGDEPVTFRHATDKTPGARSGFGSEDDEEAEETEDDDEDSCVAGEDDSSRFSLSRCIGFDGPRHVDDPDCETSGMEDDFVQPFWALKGPGCPISDPGGTVEDPES
jgi:hypothetical protein